MPNLFPYLVHNWCWLFLTCVAMAQSAIPQFRVSDLIWQVTRKPVETLGKPEIIIIYSLLLPEVILPHNHFFPLKRINQRTRRYLELIPRDIRKQLRDIRIQLWNISEQREFFNSRSEELTTASTRLWLPAVLEKIRVWVGSSVSRAHKTRSRSFLLKDFQKGTTPISVYFDLTDLVITTNDLLY